MVFQDACGKATGPSTFRLVGQAPLACGEESSALDAHTCSSLHGKQLVPGSSGCPYSRAEGGYLSGSIPSRHLLLNNITWAADHLALEQLFACYGPLESIQVFQDKGCAVLSCSSITHAEAARASLSGLRIALLTGGRPLEIAFLHPHPPSGGGAAAVSVMPTMTTTTATSVTAKDSSSPAAVTAASTTANASVVTAPLPPRSTGPLTWPSASRAFCSNDDGSTSSRTSTTSSRHESEDAATVETWRSVRRQGSSATSTSIDVSECLDTAELFYGNGGGSISGVSSGVCVSLAPSAAFCGTSRGAVAAALWLGNLERGADRYDIEALLSPYGPLEGVWFFPDRGLAFASFISSEDAAAAKSSLDGQLAPSLAGSKPLKVDFHHVQDPCNLNSPAIDSRTSVVVNAGPNEAGAVSVGVDASHVIASNVGSAVDMPLGNEPAGNSGGGAATVAATATRNHAATGRSHSNGSSGRSAAAAGPTGAGPVAAAAGVNAGGSGAAATATAAAPQAPSSAVPPAPAAPAASDVPSRHLWLGNILQNVDRQAVEATFSRFGPLESTRIFPDKHFAFVNYLSLEHAVAARAALRGQTVPALSGSRALEIRFQHRRPLACQQSSSTQQQQHQHQQLAASPDQRSAPGGSQPQCQNQLSTTAAANGGGGGSSGGNVRNAGKAGSPPPPATGGGVSNEPHIAAAAAPGGGVAGAAPGGGVAGAAERRGSSGGGSGHTAASTQPPTQVSGSMANGSGSGLGSSSYDMEPCRHLWLGNVLSSAKQQDLEAVFSRFGPVESVRIFPAKNYAFVNFKSPQSAEAAKVTLGGRPVATLTGTSPLLLRYKRLPADSALLARQPWNTAADATTAGLLPWLLLLQPGTAAATTFSAAAAAAAAAAAGGGFNHGPLPPATGSGGRLDSLNNAHAQHQDLGPSWCAAPSAMHNGAGGGSAPAGAFNDFTNNFLAQAIVANNPACLNAFTSGPQANLLQALGLRNPAAADGSAAAVGSPVAAWANGLATGPELFPQAAATGLAPYGATAGPSAPSAGGLLDTAGFCSPRDSAADAMAAAQMLWCQGLPAAAASAVGGGGPASMAAEQAIFESLAAAAMMAPPPPAPGITAAAAMADPFAGRPDMNMNALLSAMLLTQQPSH
ncbi:hypothetical protein Vafri_13938 [Volvox africanus]|uniref:RRM domain-containing protein n=1 Tax=Volvox africanus TaxID=51714 RepID=A0A8J4BC81_9CHLO|nr:hypothetical protein Vafri_13938 [Volvox africanus]